MTHAVLFFKWCSTHHTLLLSRAAQRTLQHTQLYTPYRIAFNSIRFYPIHHSYTHTRFTIGAINHRYQWKYIHNKVEITYSISSESETKETIISAKRSILESRAETHHCVRCVFVYGQCGYTRSLILNQSIDHSVSRSIDQPANQSISQ
jgi:hypothetical protein